MNSILGRSLGEQMLCELKCYNVPNKYLSIVIKYIDKVAFLDGRILDEWVAQDTRS